VIKLGSSGASRRHAASGHGTEDAVTIPDSLPDSAHPGSAHPGIGPVDLNEAARQLELAIHDARVSFDCTGLGDLDRAHTAAITARAALDSAEYVLRTALTSRDVIAPDLDRLAEG
jgi:hypothetical protein